MRPEHEEPPPEVDDQADPEIEEMLEKARQAGDPWSMPAELRDAFFAGYHVGRESGFHEGYTAGYDACDQEISRLQRAAVKATHFGEAFPDLTRDDLAPQASTSEEKRRRR